MNTIRTLNLVSSAVCATLTVVDLANHNVGATSVALAWLSGATFVTGIRGKPQSPDRDKQASKDKGLSPS